MQQSPSRRALPGKYVACGYCGGNAFTIQQVDGNLFYTCDAENCGAEWWPPEARESRQDTGGNQAMAGAKDESKHLVQTPKGKRQSLALYDRHGAHIGTLHIDSDDSQEPPTPSALSTGIRHAVRKHLGMDR